MAVVGEDRQQVGGGQKPRTEVGVRLDDQCGKPVGHPPAQFLRYESEGQAAYVAGLRIGDECAVRGEADGTPRAQGAGRDLRVTGGVLPLVEQSREARQEVSRAVQVGGGER